jgi:hypothetical protein
VVIRGGRQPQTAHSPLAQKSKFAALPPATTASAPTATDAPPILVLRGGRNRYALASAPEPSSAVEPLLAVIRGARPRPISLQSYVQPSALILRIRN